MNSKRKEILKKEEESPEEMLLFLARKNPKRKIKKTEDPNPVYLDIMIRSHRSIHPKNGTKIRNEKRS